MPPTNQEQNQQGIFQIPKDFSAKGANNSVTSLQVGQQVPVEDNNPIYDTGGIGWGTLSLITLIVIILGIAMVRYMNKQSWREFFLRPNARKPEPIQNDQNALKLMKAIVEINKKFPPQEKAEG